MRLIFTLLILVVSAGCTLTALADTSNLKIIPRWGTAWVAPQITGSWIMLKYRHDWTVETAPTGKVFIELPAGVKCVSAIGMPFQETPTTSGGSLVTLSPVNLYAPDLKGGLLYLSTTLKPGIIAKARSWAEWEGGASTPTEFDVKVADAKPVKQPKRIWTGAAMWPYMIANWPDYYKQYASLGFNHQNLWHGAIHDTDKVNADVLEIVTKAHKAGISTSINASESWGPEIWGDKPDKDAQALFIDGTRAGPCPSYRGPAFDKWQARLARIASSGISFILSDEETYGNGGYSGACVCPRCEARWRKWLKANRPEMAYISPTDVINKYSAAANVVAFDKLEAVKVGADLSEAISRNDDIEEQYRAWLWFRASLTTERYELYKKAIVKACKEFGVKSSPKPCLAGGQALLRIMGWLSACRTDAP